MADPDEALIEAIRAIGREHRPASVSVLDGSVICACGVESMEMDGLELHRSELIVAAMVEHLGLTEETIPAGYWARDSKPMRRLVSRWTEVDHGSE